MEIENIEIGEFKEYAVIGLHKEYKIAALMGMFDTMEEATTFTGIEGMQPEAEGVELSVFRRVD